MKIKDGGGAAWRARYLYTDTGKQLARVVLDPNCQTNRPVLSVAVPVGAYRACDGRFYPKLWEVRISLPAVRWRSGRGRAGRWLYRLSAKFWHQVDGRYGWRGSCR